MAGDEEEDRVDGKRKKYSCVRNELQLASCIRWRILLRIFFSGRTYIIGPCGVATPGHGLVFRLHCVSLIIHFLPPPATLCLSTSFLLLSIFFLKLKLSSMAGAAIECCETLFRSVLLDLQLHVLKSNLELV